MSHILVNSIFGSLNAQNSSKEYWLPFEALRGALVVMIWRFSRHRKNGQHSATLSASITVTWLYLIHSTQFALWCTYKRNVEQLQPNFFHLISHSQPPLIKLKLTCRRSTTIFGCMKCSNATMVGLVWVVTRELWLWATPQGRPADYFADLRFVKGALKSRRTRSVDYWNKKSEKPTGVTTWYVCAQL